MQLKRTKRVLRRIDGAIVTLLIVAFAAGCAGGSEDELSITEQQRREYGPQVAKYMLEAQRAYELGTFTTALALTDSVEAIAPDLTDMHYLRGTIYSQLNQMDVAEAAFETVLGIDPDYPRARYNSALLSARMGKLRDAIELLKQENELHSDSNILLELGRAYARLGEPDSARIAYEASLALDDSNSTAYMWLGQLYEELGDLESALEVSNKGLALRPNNTDYQYIVGSLLLRLDDVEQAASYLAPVAEKRPYHHGVQMNMGQVLMRQGREDDARAFFARADSAQQLNQQIAELEEAINREPRAIERWIDLGQLLRKAGELDKAIDAFEVAVALHPSNMRLQSNLALLNMETGNLEAAIERYSAIVGTDSTLADVWLNLGAAHANAGHREAAQDAWEKVLTLEPGHPVAKAYLARVDEISEES